MQVCVERLSAGFFLAWDGIERRSGKKGGVKEGGTMEGVLET